ncbi:IS3 family transposase [Corynebacterium striatum]|uniref:IS3 family transposase n=1 Tax=Corynebacterium striatum TaxID=43770 RepID=UPI001A1CA86B|nr:IS3 family transposase [Corynebacterium striatum]HAT1476513.1 IS3 family transposase [Corynebacterium striatum]HAT6526642.1 IS3 family transposase [Corynebacterium striatum]HAT6564776.1 IS3 family transposase [Corynebacterium striatum]HAT6570149.1 IS3 family transposase [Corynebacterium striatum]
MEHIRDVHAENCGVYGVRKMWRVLRRQGVDIGREHTARLMRSAGLSGKGKGGAPITTRKPTGPGLRPDLVHREFKAQALIGCGWRGIAYVRSRKKGSCTQLLSLMCNPGGSSGGVVGFDAH